MPKKLPHKAEVWWNSSLSGDEWTTEINSVMIGNLDAADIADLIAGKATPRTKALGKRLKEAFAAYKKKNG